MSRREVAELLKKAAANYFFRYRYSCAYEIGLKAWGRRRADVVANKVSGYLVVVEVKSCVSDFSSDCKWTEYLNYADKVYLAFSESTWAKVKNNKALNERIPECVGVLVLSPQTGYMRVAKKAQQLELSSKTRMSVLARLAWRNGDLSKRVKRARERIYVE